MKIRASQVVAASVVAILVSIPLCGLGRSATWTDHAGTAMGLVGLLLFWSGAVLLFTASQYSTWPSTPNKPEQRDEFQSLLSKPKLPEEDSKEEKR